MMMGTAAAAGGAVGHGAPNTAAAYPYPYPYQSTSGLHEQGYGEQYYGGAYGNYTYDQSQGAAVVAGGGGAGVEGEGGGLMGYMGGYAEDAAQEPVAEEPQVLKNVIGYLTRCLPHSMWLNVDLQITYSADG